MLREIIRWTGYKFLVCMLSCFNRVRLFAISWTLARWAPPSMGFSQARILEWVDISSSRDPSDPGIKPGSPASSVFSCIVGGFFTAKLPGKLDIRWGATKEKGSFEGGQI